MLTLPSIRALWKKLLLVNYVIDPALLDPYLPSKTEHVFREEKCFISLVGFLFLDVRFGGIPVPMHTKFEEVNLRFYVRHRRGGDWRHGVVFIKEIVPLPLVTLVANSLFREHYETMSMRHALEETDTHVDLSYSWKKNAWNSIHIRTQKQLHEIDDDSVEHFLTSQHWGYTKINEQKTLEYSVTHPRWQVYPTLDHSVDVDFGHVFGKEFTFLREQEPDSVFLAEGSAITLKGTQTLPDHE